jgi:hypothetical protein
MLHITDTNFSPRGEPENRKPTKTMSMNSWLDGDDVILNFFIQRDDDGTPRLKVYTNTENLFDYRLEGWDQPQPDSPNSGSELTIDGQRSFSPDETIQFKKFWNEETKRGVMLWMEPHAQWLARRNQ